MTYYSLSAIDKLSAAYREKKGFCCDVISDGVLGYGIMVLSAPGYKYAVVKEVPLNCWSSAHTVRFYNKLPKKYDRGWVD